MMRAQCVLEARVSCTGINEVGPTELPNVAKPLKNFGVDELQRQLVDADVVPDGVAQNLEARSPLILFGPR
jgi:hypothetical protein